MRLFLNWFEEKHRAVKWRAWRINKWDAWCKNGFDFSKYSNAFLTYLENESIYRDLDSVLYFLHENCENLNRQRSINRCSVHTHGKARRNVKLSQTAWKKNVKKVKRGARYLTPIISSDERTHRFFFFLPFAYRSPFIMTALNEYTTDKVHMPGPWVTILTSSWRESYLETRHLVKFHQFLRIARFWNDATLEDASFISSRLRLIVSLQSLFKASFKPYLT